MLLLISYIYSESLLCYGRLIYKQNYSNKTLISSRIIEYSRPLEFWDTEEDLHGGAEVATVAQVPDPRVARPVDRLQLEAGLLNELPLGGPWACVVIGVMPVFRLIKHKHTRDGFIIERFIIL